MNTALLKLAAAAYDANKPQLGDDLIVMAVDAITLYHTVVSDFTDYTVMQALMTRTQPMLLRRQAG